MIFSTWKHYTRPKEDAYLIKSMDGGIIIIVNKPMMEHRLFGMNIQPYPWQCRCYLMDRFYERHEIFMRIRSMYDDYFLLLSRAKSAVEKVLKTYECEIVNEERWNKLSILF